jgi:signal transduction histidine kinase
VVLAVTTYFVARSYLLDQREQSAERQGFANARLARSALRSSGVDVASLVTTIRGESGSEIVVRSGDAWYSSSVAVGRDDIPVELRTVTADGHAGRELIRTRKGGLQLVVGTPIAAVDADYFEVFSLNEFERTLSLLRNTLLVGAILTSVSAALAGRYAAGRVVGPLGPIATAAARIAEGDLETRLPPHHDRDLAPLTEGFNTMAASLQERIEREARFASDVSHELRSPLAALRAATEVMDRRRRHLPDSVSPALDVLTSRVRSFEELVLDLLEISRFDAHAVMPTFEELNLETFVRQVLAVNGASEATIVIDEDAPETFTADRRRLAQAFGNIIQNGAKYAGGVTRVTVDGNDDQIEFLIDDAGAGIDPSERLSIFQRFARGEAGRRAGTASGTGLGLALATAQVELHRGRLKVDDAPTGGARFVLTLPRRQPG